ncbi:MAG: oxidoreductase domain protein [Acidimicrobiaceae bacterium]|nr:oxidoreductase domain protein [Acidimicrobiaceae bacterium]
MRKIRIGVIGAGVWATTSHLPVLARRPDDVEFIAVCRKGAAEVAAVAKEFGFAVATEDYREVLASGVDACIVASPAYLHHEHARAALEAGCHVLLEKPVAIASSDAWDLVELARSTGKHLVISFGWNYLPTYVTARELLDAHGIGEVTGMSVHMDSGIRELLLGESLSSTGDVNDRADTATWTSRELSGGGYAQAALPHALGVALGLAGVRAEAVSAFGAGGNEAGIELYDAFAVRFAGGAVGTVSGMAHHAPASLRHELEVRIFGSNGQIHLDYFRDHLRMWNASGFEIEPALPPDAGVYNCDGPPNALVDLALGLDIRNHSPGELGAATVELIEAAYESMTSGRPALVAGGRPR